jgi:hypothetical protein
MGKGSLARSLSGFYGLVFRCQRGGITSGRPGGTGEKNGAIKQKDSIFAAASE